MAVTISDEMRAKAWELLKQECAGDWKVAEPTLVMAGKRNLDTILDFIAPLIANAQIEACAEVARLAIYIAANQEYRTSKLKIQRPPSCVDYAKAAYAAIRALKEE